MGLKKGIRMLTKDFYFELPHSLIAQTPSAVRGDDRLMILNRGDGSIEHLRMDDLPAYIPHNALMVFNDSRVRRSRIYAQKEGSETKREFLFLEAADGTGHIWKTTTKNARKCRVGQVFIFDDGSRAEVSALHHESCMLAFESARTEGWFESLGHMPLPPYIRRDDTVEDGERYQNVYAKVPGSAACATAGLHFTESMLKRLDAAGVERAALTLHVGLATFLPVRTEHAEDHPMHEETFTISADTAERVAQARIAGRPIIAVGTTSVRALESSWDAGRVKSGTQKTSIFMYPGYRFQAVDMLFTNFHTPESTLLMLVSAFAGKDLILHAYETAVKEGYRFFSYGDAMLIR